MACVRVGWVVCWVCAACRVVSSVLPPPPPSHGPVAYHHRPERSLCYFTWDPVSGACAMLPYKTHQTRPLAPSAHCHALAHRRPLCLRVADPNAVLLRPSVAITHARAARAKHLHAMASMS
ncbi:hypothetical protein EDB80DRAFT_703691 [Ilyonectria destructans]|nr:hypothetical protein EDB80DRAFT_703691 [Ilyonectria destructans]